MAQELQAGRPPPIAWRLAIADAEGTILDTISFGAVAFGHGMPGALLGSRETRQLVEHVRHTIRQGREHRASLRAGIAEARDQLRTLGRLNATLDKRSNSEE